MNNEALSTRIAFREVNQEDFDFLYQMHVATMKEYVDQTWGWEDDFQKKVFQERFDPSEIQMITFNNIDIGVISLLKKKEEIFLRAIEILPQYQSKGIGTWLIKNIIQEGELSRVPVILYVLKVNPAQKLYKRLGFHIVSETTTHYFMRKDCRKVAYRLIAVSRGEQESDQIKQ
jgi:ribosomal protein S18 acetylase RimI-like enzyme